METAPWYLSVTPLVTVPWLVRLRWTSVAIQVAALTAGVALTGYDFPLRRVWPFIFAAAVVHGLRAVTLSRTSATPAWLDLLGLLVDAALLTMLLEMTGGPLNPFGVVFALQIALAALTLGRGETWLTALAAATGFGLLVYWHSLEPDPVHHRLNDFPTHLFTMWMAFAVTAELVAYFVLQASTALDRREQALEAMRQQAARTERLMSMTTLAAGAAHELSTPLATIALASRELERSAVAQGGADGLVDDARLIRAEVDRCRAILDQMSGRAGGVAADDPEAVAIDVVFQDVWARLGESAAQRVAVDIAPSARTVFLPRAGLSQALLSLIKNALDASSDASGGTVSAGGAAAAGLDAAHTVQVAVAQHAGRLRVSVRDRGTGMPPHVLARAGEPFFTTKEPGRGLGLGLFLARIFAERVGGTLALDSADGTTATLDLPLRAEFSREATL